MKTKRVNDKVIIIENNDVITYEGLLDIFYAHNLNIRDENVTDAIYDILILRRLSYNEVWEIVSGASKMKVMCKKDQKRVSVDLDEFLAQIRSEYNLQLYAIMGRVDQKFKQYLKDDLLEIRKNGLLSTAEYKDERKKAMSSIDGLIKKAWQKIKNVTDEIDTRLENFTIEELEDLYAYACIYDAIIKHTPTREWTDGEGNDYLRVADYIFSDGYLRLNRPSNIKSLGETIQKLLDAMTTLDERFGEREVFNKKEIADILVNAPSLLKVVNAQKFKATQECLVAYVNELISRAKNSEFETAMKSLTAKEIIKRSGSILNSSGTAVFQATNFLLGKTVGEIYAEQLANGKFIYNRAEHKHTFENFPNLQIENMTLNDHKRISTKQVSVLIGLSFNSLNIVMESLLDVLISAQYPNIDLQKINIEDKKKLVEKMGVDYNHLLTGKNISSLFRSDVKNTLAGYKFDDMVANMRLLNKYVSFETIVNTLKNNINVLLQKDGVLKGKIDEILKKYPDIKSKEFRDEFILMLNSDYSAGMIFDGTKTPGRKIKKESESNADNVHDWVDVKFNGASEAPTPINLTDEEKYQRVHSEILSLNRICVLMEEHDLSDESLDKDLLTIWNELKKEIKKKTTENSNAELSGVLSNKLRRSIVGYDDNLTPKVSVVSTLREIGEMAGSINSVEIKKCLRPELEAIVLRIEKLLDDKLSEILDDVDELTSKFYHEDKKHTKTANAKKYTAGIEKIDSVLEQLSTLDESIIGKMTSKSALKRDREMLAGLEQNMIDYYNEYKQKRARNAKLEKMHAELSETIFVFGLVKNYLANLSNLLPQTVVEQSAKKQVEDIPTVEDDEIVALETRLEELKKKVGKKVFESLKGNYKGKDFKRLYHNMGLEVGDDLYNDMLEISNIFKQLDKIRQSSISSDKDNTVQQ